MIYFFLAILPIAMALVLMTKFKVQPGIALPLSWTCSMLCGCIVWQLPFLDLLAVSLYGVLKSFDIILIVFCAVLLLNILKKNNAFDVINSTFGTMSADRRIQLIVIAWFFSSFIEGAAGFGSAPALVAPLLAALGFPVLIACTTALIGNTLPVPFGAVGTPTITLNSILSGNLASCGVSGEIFAKQLMQVFTDISMLSGMFLPLLLVSFMIILDGGKHKIKAIVEIIPFCFVSGIVYFIPWKLAAVFLGPELPSMVGPVCAFPVILLLLKFKPSFLIPVKAWDFKENSQQQEFPVFEKKQIIQAWMPYFLIALLLIITRLPMLPFKAWLTAVKLSLPPIGRINGTALSWAWLYNPGVFPFLAVSFYTMFSFGIKRQNVADFFLSSARQVKQASIAIAASFAIVQIMIHSSGNFAGIPGMLTVIAVAAADTLGKAYLIASPVIGAMGTFFAGSCTVSNILFGSIQFDTAHISGLSEEVAVALQNIGGGIGSMIRISGVVATCATVNASGKEGRIILLNTIPAVIMILLALLAVVFILA